MRGVNLKFSIPMYVSLNKRKILHFDAPRSFAALEIHQYRRFEVGENKSTNRFLDLFSPGPRATPTEWSIHSREPRQASLGYRFVLSLGACTCAESIDFTFLNGQFEAQLRAIPIDINHQRRTTRVTV